ncbi:MAG: chemotaxis protein CheW [Candidatus Aquicultor secundus]|uniref:Chemotaxis protein CheW n=1 Tax=Candidatus Aquicultor secundus TaxID=1973895 RepID=A0A2M7T9E8_9ACTN|nr:chemotaxis protein CheW [Candidatus Aquicultor secundus]NCO65968.1 purine-binding chemotaxis protein CheW [Solirubrobacter sp.]OIO86056.1 MAG: chemotaxis protein CheW [Candidatus Aquicultor secundus]PIU27393.1 MAG: chemotaxis protein CheW [Candidatus Aquicultor secundus]PIW22012.1 MAG: chemotaxis protein CheW [Candidatus Aquicultor secundus]PIX52579.1 MAG: chemotaxis protein CheW [Candidatus Aquicultor secundus]
MSKLEQVNEAISTATANQFVTFTLGDEEYGIAILKVQEIIGYPGFTKIPNMPSFVKGVINLRGSVVPVIDLRLKFAMQEREYDTYTVIAILEVKEKVIGVIVDAVSDVITLKEDEMQPTPDFSSGVKVEFISGMGRKGDTLIILLDIDRVLSEGEIGMLSAA